MSGASRRLAAIMFTDMVGFTALGQRNESVSLALMEEQRKLLRSILGRHNGREIKTMGDGFLIEFPSALDAVRCAYEIQRSARELNLSLPEDRQLHLRVGVHLGDVVDSSGDIVGDAVNVASRIEPLAEPGGVCVSQQVYDHVRNKTDLSFRRIGEMVLKNVDLPVATYRIELPWEAASTERQGPRSRIAVLPFANISPDPNDSYFADGLTEELIGRLSQIEGLRVIARTSVMNYKDNSKKVTEIGRELGVGSIVEGSVRKAGSRIRVSVQLIDARSEEHLWASSYDKELDDIFGIQSDVAARVAGSLASHVLPSSGGAEPVNVEAYTLYLKAVQIHYEDVSPRLRVAVPLLERALRIDPTFARAYARLAHVWAGLAMVGVEEWSVAITKAEAAARKALEIDPASADAHGALARVHGLVDRYTDSIAEAEAAIRINPNLSNAYLTLGVEYAALGRLDDGIGAFRRAFELDPLWEHTGLQYVMAALAAGLFEESAGVLQRMAALAPSSPEVQVGFADFHMARGEYAKAEEVLQKALVAHPNHPGVLVDWGVLQGLQGHRAAAEETIARLDVGGVEAGTVSSRFWIRTAMGDLDESFRALQRMGESHAWPFILNVDPFFAELRKDPRYLAFRQQVHLPDTPTSSTGRS